MLEERRALRKLAATAAAASATNSGLSTEAMSVSVQSSGHPFRASKQVINPIAR